MLGDYSYFIVMDELLSLFNFDLEIFNINGFFFFLGVLDIKEEVEERDIRCC